MTKITIPQNFKATVNKSAKNLSLAKRFSMLCGANVPSFFSDMYPNDYWKLSVDSLLQSSALQAPLMGTFKLRNVLVFEPYSNLYGWYDNNTRETTANLMQKRLHTFTFMNTSDGNSYKPQIDRPSVGDVTGIPRGGIYDYLGIAPGTIQVDTDTELTICIDRILAYIDFVRMYSVNRQEENAYYISQSTASTEDFDIVSVPISTLDSLFMELRYLKNGFQFGIDEPTEDQIGMTWLVDYLQSSTSGKNSGLFLCLYEPDYFMNFLNKSTGTVSSRVTVGSDNTFSIHEMYFRNKIQKIIDAYDLSGGVFTNWSRTLWGAKPRGSQDVPDIVGSVTHIIDPSNITIVSNTYQGDIGSHAGELAGNINQYNTGDRDHNNRFHVGTQEEGIFMVITQLIPMPDYSQGIDPQLIRTTYMDKYKIQLQRLGFQDIPQSIYCSLPNTDTNGNLVIGNPNSYSPERVLYKQIAWLDLMTATNRVHGDFANFGNKEYWTLNRRFGTYTSAGSGDTSRAVSRKSFSRYVDPRDWQYPFAGTSLSDHNFFLQLGFGIKAIRPIGKRFTPSMN